MGDWGEVEIEALSEELIFEPCREWVGNERGGRKPLLQPLPAAAALAVREWRRAKAPAEGGASPVQRTSNGAWSQALEGSG